LPVPWHWIPDRTVRWPAKRYFAAEQKTGLRQKTGRPGKSFLSRARTLIAFATNTQCCAGKGQVHPDVAPECSDIRSADLQIGMSIKGFL